MKKRFQCLPRFASCALYSKGNRTLGQFWTDVSVMLKMHPMETERNHRNPVEYPLYTWAEEWFMYWINTHVHAVISDQWGNLHVRNSKELSEETNNKLA